jgi:class 3 adenylate cyclase
MLQRYIQSFDGTSLAIIARGDPASRPLVAVPPWATTVWTDVMGVSLLDRLARHRRVIRWDRRGVGASQRTVTDLGLDGQVGDLTAVADDEGLSSFDLYASFDACPIAIAFAFGAPERVRKLVLWHPFVDGSTWLPPDRVRGLIELAASDWLLATRTLATVWMPRATAEHQRDFARGLRERIEPDVFVGSLLAMQAMNAVGAARAVKAPTLVLSTAGAGVPLRPAQEVASLIPGATLRIVEQRTPGVNDEAVPNLILEFLDGSAPASPPQGSTTAVILFTDVADSTGITERVGDAAFRDESRRLDAALRSSIRDAGGSTVDGKLLGDGVLATFSSAAQAIDGARRCLALSAASKLRLHIGLHAGDVIREGNNVFGGAVNVAARICELSAPGEIFVSDVVRGMALTSAGASFDDRGEHRVKGIREPLRLFAVLPTTS